MWVWKTGTPSCSACSGRRPGQKPPRQPTASPPAAGRAGQQQSNSGRSPMAFYLMRFSYTPETWAKLMQNPEDRRGAARAYIEQVGGTLHGFWYGFGKYDA